MRRWCLLLLIGFMGCASTQVPIYIKDKNPYVKRYYADYDQAHAAVLTTLKDLGWEIEGSTDPETYEQNKGSDLNGKRILIMTTIRQTALFVGTRYAKMNFFLRSKEGITEVEIRYVTVTSVLFTNFTSYRNDSEVTRIYDYLEKTLKENK